VDTKYKASTMWSICIRVVLVMIFALHCPFSMAPLMVLAWDSDMETPCCPHRIRHHRGNVKTIFVDCYYSLLFRRLHPTYTQWTNVIIVHHETLTLRMLGHNSQQHKMCKSIEQLTIDIDHYHLCCMLCMLSHF